MEINSKLIKKINNQLKINQNYFKINQKLMEH